MPIGQIRFVVVQPESFLTSFDTNNLDRLAATAPAWRSEQMHAAYRIFDALSEPTGLEEDWRYVEFDMPFTGLGPVLAPGEQLEPGPFLTAVGEASGKVVIVDGHVVSVDSDGATVSRIAEMEHDPGLRGSVPPDHNKLAAAHAAFATDGIVVDVPANKVLDQPLVVDVQSVTPDSATFPHLVVRVGENAEASVLVVYRSAPGVSLLMIPEVDLSLGDGARLRYLSVQGLDHAATIVVHQRIHLGRDSTSRVGEVGLGAGLARLDVGVDLAGDGSSSEIVGLYFGEEDQTLDYRMVINHQGKRTSSDVFLKGAVEDNAQSVFTGLLRIEKDATRTSTFETNRNLVLSENAKAQSVPNLEILCDDVVCGHASSVGPLEGDHLYYLMSRGLPRERAERLLIRGFFQEVIDRLPIKSVEKPISDEVFRRFISAQEEGRVSS
jgi:Fe-S cluster assembly protein SufD